MVGDSAGSQDKLRLFAAPSIADSDVVAVADAISVNGVVVADAIGVTGVVGADDTVVVGQLLLNPALVPVSDPHRIRSWVQTLVFKFISYIQYILNNLEHGINLPYLSLSKIYPGEGSCMMLLSEPMVTVLTTIV